ncbi:hypothetical protein MC885_020499, partial [Smutsia gigantea]
GSLKSAAGTQKAPGLRQIPTAKCSYREPPLHRPTRPSQVRGLNGVSGPGGSSRLGTTTPSSPRGAPWTTLGERPPLSAAEVRRSSGGRAWSLPQPRIGKTGGETRRQGRTLPTLSAPVAQPRSLGLQALLPFAAGLAPRSAGWAGPGESCLSGLVPARGLRPRGPLSPGGARGSQPNAPGGATLRLLRGLQGAADPGPRVGRPGAANQVGIAVAFCVSTESSAPGRHLVD